MPRYLITGIAGFIGSSIARQLVADGAQVVGLDNLSNGTLENLRDISKHIDMRIADVRDLEAVRSACQGVDCVFHQAALASVPRSILDPINTHSNNLDGTLHVLVAARDAGVRRVVYAASSSAYGDQPTPLKSESLAPLPLSPYAVQKLAGEFYLQAFYRVYGLQTVCLRYFNIFGPRQSADSPYSGVIAQFINTMLRQERPTIFGDGEQSRDFTFVDNAVRANILACHAPATRVAGGVFNIGTGRSQTLNTLYATLCKLLHSSGPAHYAAPRMGDIQHSQADICQAQQALDYTPSVHFEEGLQSTVQWYLETNAKIAVSGNLAPYTVPEIAHAAG